MMNPTLMQTDLYKLYTVESQLGRPGFGIATDMNSRAWHYADHAGGILTFPVIWGGRKTHARSVESDITRHFADKLWIPHEGKQAREWLDDKHLGKVQLIIDFIKDTIQKQDLELKIIKTNYRPNVE